jgi:hypothetical protein
VGGVERGGLSDASAALHELAHVQGHLAAQDAVLTKIAEKFGHDPVPVIDETPPDDGTGSETAPTPACQRRCGRIPAWS